MDKEAQSATTHMSLNKILQEQAHDKAMPLVERALTPKGHCRPFDT